MRLTTALDFLGSSMDAMSPTRAFDFLISFSPDIMRLTTALDFLGLPLVAMSLTTAFDSFAFSFLDSCLIFLIRGFFPFFLILFCSLTSKVSFEGVIETSFLAGVGIEIRVDEDAFEIFLGGSFSFRDFFLAGTS